MLYLTNFPYPKPSRRPHLPMGAKSILLHSSYSSTKPRCYLSSPQSCWTESRTTNLRFERKVVLGKQVKWESLGLTSRREVKKEKGGVVRCTAEGIERRMLIPGEATVRVPERFKVVAFMACVMCLCNADRVVMSVAVVPLADKLGRSSSFLGIVQVNINSSFSEFF